MPEPGTAPIIRQRALIGNHRREKSRPGIEAKCKGHHWGSVVETAGIEHYVGAVLSVLGPTRIKRDFP